MRLRSHQIHAKSEGEWYGPSQESPRRWHQSRCPRGRRYRTGPGVYGRLFDFNLRGKSEGAAFIDLGDQFIALQKGRQQPGDDGRHFGLVVDDKEAMRTALAAAGVKVLPGRFLDFLDPWGNRIEIVGYENIQFSKAPNVLRGMGLQHLSKNGTATKELTDKGMAPD